jgi:hypothetical protein
MSRLTDSELAQFFAAASHEHEIAVEQEGLVERVLAFGHAHVMLRFAGSALAGALMGALAPRAVNHPGPVAATINLWEESAVGGAHPVPWTEQEIGARGLVDVSGGSVVAVHEAGSLAVTVVDRGERKLLYRVPSASALPWWERAAPLRPALSWALSGPGRDLVHAGAVGDADRGAVLLAGAGGSGKTTVSLAALAAGLSYAGDDYVLVDTAGEPTAWNMFATAKLDSGHLARFPALVSAVTGRADAASDEKAVLDVARLFGDQLARSLAIRALVIPRITGGRTDIRPATGGEALRALAPSTAFQMPFNRAGVLGSLAALARRVPAFALDVGDDPGELSLAVDRALELAAADRPIPSTSARSAAA